MYILLFPSNVVVVVVRVRDLRPKGSPSRPVPYGARRDAQHARAGEMPLTAARGW